MRFFVWFWCAVIANISVASHSDATPLPKNLTLQPLYTGTDQLTNKYRQVVRDHSGYLWIATDKRIERYDGYQIRAYSTSVAPSTGIAYKLFITSTGMLFTARGDQISRYNPHLDSFESMTLFPGKAIRHMSESKNGLVWIAGDGFGLVALDPKLFSVVRTTSSVAMPRVLSTAATAQDPNKLWLVSENGLSLFDTKTANIEQHFEQLSAANGIDTIVDVVEDSHGIVWLAATNGLYRFNSLTGEKIHYSSSDDREHGIKSRMISRVFEDRDGRLWIGTDKQGLHVYRPETDDFAHYPSSETNSYDLPVATVSDIYQDTEGTIWVAMSAFGIVKLNLNLAKFEPILAVQSDKTTLSSNNILDIMEASDGAIWIGTDGAGLNRFDPITGKVKQYAHDPKDPTSVSSDAILSITETPSGNLWMGTWAGGINFFDRKTQSFTRISRQPQLPPTETLARSNIFDVVAIGDNQLLISCWGYGLQLYDVSTGTFKNYSPFLEQDRGIQSFEIRSITASTEPNEFWLSGFFGVEKFNLATGRSTPVNIDNLSEVTEVFVESSQRLWIASNNGLFEYYPQTGRYVHHIISDYEPSNTIMSIEPDDENRLWLGTRKGLAMFDKKTQTVEFFDSGDGLPGEQFNYFAHHRTQDGTLYFGSLKGLIRFNPNKLPRNTTPPKVHITDIKLGQTYLTPSEDGPLKQALQHTQQLLIPYNTPDITFSFAALSFIYPQKNQYRYRLKGYEQDWITASAAERNVRYTNLSHGDYVFEVEGTNNDGVWSASRATIQLTVTPPWWELWWVKTLMVIAILLIIYGISSLRVWHTRRRTKILNAIVKQRTQALQLAKDNVDRLLQMAYHDTLTQLPNRSWLINRIDEIIQTDPREPLGLLFLDGDKFKSINDNYGHSVGDQLLIASANRLKSLMNHDQTVIRLAGDEFVVIAETNATQKTMTQLAQRIITAFGEPFDLRHGSFAFSFSIGVAICDESYTCVKDCLRDADLAMYEAKKHGKGTYQFFEPRLLENSENQIIDTAEQRRRTLR